MALVNCTGCGRQISSKARSCPKCGCSATDAEQTGADRPEPNEPSGRALSAAEQSAAVEPALPDAPTTVDPQEGPQIDPEEWYYVASSGRSGPVSLPALRKLAAQGHIEDATSIWKAGLADWIPLSSYEEAAFELSAAALPPAAAAPSKGYIWPLALAPVWGTALQVVATELWVALTHKQLAYYAQFWWITFGSLFLCSYLDFRSYRKDRPAGLDFGGYPGEQTAARQVGTLIFLLVPAYVYLRAKKLDRRLLHFWVWLFSLLLWLTSSLYLNASYARIYGK